ncbi:MAG TPA: prepilin-type N-terminal cleavage/methylation domain-containing protein [Sumerlaeia bacterium]|nr:prepilin-type N-terminal cleavage/methylation domain-containing protein [Sumerlaeia bacterium]
MLSPFHSVHKRRGFTLIELLIVVAIIAILAAIAVPNFLEAQVRSKVSRVTSDLRALATAIEAYRIDNNAYMPYSLWGQHTDSPYLNALSTPVAYITSSASMKDPFWGQGDRTVDNTEPRYGYVKAWPDQAGGGAPVLHRLAQEGIDDGYMPSSVQWFLVSLGPDKIQNADTGGTPHMFLLYDPTNGTRSGGDIYRWGP